MRLQHQTFELFADYHQFYLWDRSMNVWAPKDYADEDIERRLKAGPNVVVVQPERNMTVPAELEVYDGEPPYDPALWDHIAECSLELPTGQLDVHGCTGGSVARLEVEPGPYRVRSFHGGFETISWNGLDGKDLYRVGTSVSTTDRTSCARYTRRDRVTVSSTRFPP